MLEFEKIRKNASPILNFLAFLIVTLITYVRGGAQAYLVNFDSNYADASHDIQMGVADKYRSLAFELNPQFGFTGTITVFDNVATDENIVLFESMMRHQVLPIMNSNMHCYEILNAFWTTYYRSLTTQPVAVHESVCKWLLTKISVDKNAAGIPVAQPLDIEREFGLTEGNIFQGELTLEQLFFLRPVPGYAQYATPVERLYMCGSATHPGGGIMGAPGRNAATRILKDGRR